jgi:aldose 1-epimerase
VTHAFRILVVIGGAAAIVACQSTPPPAQQPARLARAAWGTSVDGTPVELFTLRNANGMEIGVVTLGGIITTWRAADRDGAFDDVVLGHDAVAGYQPNPTYFGTLIGRYGNRIAGGKFTLDGATYTLARNNGPNHLHGGNKGWDQAVWRAAPFDRQGEVGLVLTHRSPDGDEGYPGTIDARVTYTLNDRNELRVDYQATTDKPTVINLTQHSYFNLAGARANDILTHELMLNAPTFTPVDETLIPTGEIAPVAGTPFDFTTPTPIGARINQADVQLQRGRGYDHNFVLARTGEGLSLAARVYEPISGRTLEITTTEPGIQFYSGNFLDGTIKGKGGRVYGQRSGFCLETQHYPDSPNRANFPSTELRPGQQYRSSTVFALGVRK